MGARVFICGDTLQERLLSEVTRTLRDLGHEVVRGPLDSSGTLRRYSAEECERLIAPVDAAVFTVRHECSRELMTAAPRLRGVFFPTIGVESLDLAAARELGVIVGHGAVRENVVGMAEATLMLMLMLLYRVEVNIGFMRDGQWRSPMPIARQLEGRIVGIVGLGRIGRELARRLQAFGVRVLACAPRTAQEHMPVGVTKADLNMLLRQSHIVSVLTGLTPETNQLIGAAQLALMRPDAYLVNTSRGGVLDEAALYTALHERRIAGAALDTFAVEPLQADSPLRELDNVILTPHGVGHTIEGAAAFGPALVENIRRTLAGELPLYCKNPDTETAWRRRLRQISGESL